MNLKIIKIVLLALTLNLECFGQQDQYFKKTYDFLSNMLETNKLDFKECVFKVENAYFDNQISYSDFDAHINHLIQICKMRIKADSIRYAGKDYEKVEKNWAIFKTLTDTTYFQLSDTAFLIHTPYKYDFEDIWGHTDWRNTFVMKLLVEKKGNCHSIPYLYKILSDALQADAFLALAPNHLYVKIQTQKVGWFNTELTSATFPIDAWLMASGYISLESIQKGVYLNALNEKEHVALCVLDLAQGYNRKFPANDGKFIIACCDLAIKYFPNYINAILFKAETYLKQLQVLQKQQGYKQLKEVAATIDGKVKWEEMNRLYMQLYKSGYRQMPAQMYVDWLTSLQKEREKYANKQLMESHK